ncbi:galactokinase family protein [Scrofimicrobium sp. R131]|uniref:Galactokinase family protein n=1 Tax=Scrofimicrobium appendicitidis TaxID=3079930 RepID=A0AAU7V468_9ACTO
MSWFVPGRLEVLGKHTDYAGGKSLLAAIDRGVTATIQPAREGITATTTAVPGIVNADGTDSLPAGHWGNYVRTVVERLQANFGSLQPAHIEVDSTLPLASGMSSSSALMVAIALSLIDENHLRDSAQWQENIGDNIDLAGYLSTIENGLSFKGLAGQRGVGTFGGSEDHTAMLHAQPGRISEFSFCPIREESQVDFPDNWSFVIAMSGVPAEKTGAAREAYNRASAQAAELVTLWNRDTGAVEHYLADILATGEQARNHLTKLAEAAGLGSRLQAYLVETEVAIPAALAGLRSDQMDRFGQAANQSHANARDVLGNQVPETNRLQELALELGAVGSTGFGAGFGGSVWAAVPSESAPEFSERWLEAYLGEFPARAEAASVMVGRPGSPAHRL